MGAEQPVRILRLAGLLLACAFAVTACGKGRGPEQPPERGDQAVATVDDQTIWASDVKREAVSQGLIGEGEPLEVTSDVFHRVLDEVVDQKLLAAEAARRKLDKDPLAQRRLAAARERVMGDLLVESVVADAVNENAIRNLYQEQLKLAKRSEEIHARQIVTATQAEAETVKKLIGSGASFEALAMEKSTDAATRFNGGDMGYFTTDVMPEAYVAALKSAKKGQLVGPVAVDGGYALIKVEDRRLEAPLTFDAARPQIVRFLTYDQIRDQLEKLRGRARIVRLIKGEAQGPPAPPPADAPKAQPKPAESAVTPAIAKGGTR
ncbi:peptidylprolyl isomerase [Phenylobacterium soli]|uniref:Parvulin-like PPIase n=1 Tax=Phenylobacterium soli TaxID=2170551 RepID=A0A328ABW7_9CAUL|nr:peptidylprolyl isomerase [Phenylobacterium soli]RAK51706.1 peptidylprolyl isomerase [Phenylobacterium soli]